jgi:hypothetical protein
MKAMLVLAAFGEAATGVALLLVPSLVGQWLFGAELIGVGITMARVTGIALVGLGIACWPGPSQLGMLVYSAGAALFLTWVGLSGGSGGVLLWPAVDRAPDPDGGFDPQLQAGPTGRIRVADGRPTRRFVRRMGGACRTFGSLSERGEVPI